MSVNHLPDCPTDCTGAEIEKIYLWVDSATPPFDTDLQYQDPAHWATHLNQTATAISDIREFTVIGEMPEPEQTETPISGDRTVIGYKKFTVNFEIDETNEINYNFLLASECNGKYKANFETADGILYGGYLGLDVSVKMNQVIPRERTGLVKIMGKLTWTSKNHPFRQISHTA
jgi:hypothetical protein